MTKFTNFIYIIVFFLLFTSCNSETKVANLQEGTWRGQISMQDHNLPFLFEVAKNKEVFEITLINNEERFKMDNVKVTSDSLFFSMHIFDIDIKAKINENSLSGLYVKNYLNDYQLPFTAAFNNTVRFENAQSTSDFNGKWDLTFYSEDGNTTKGVGIFEQKDNLLNGTILTPTGDYRYLEGPNSKSDFTLNTFDGNHAFIFEASKKENDSIFGTFYAGKTFNERFVGVKNSEITLPDANKLTYLKDGYDKLEFSFPDLDGNMVSLTDEKYQDKVVLVQIFGTWCPNCMDETRFYRDYYEKNKARGVEIIGLAYEVKDDFNYAKSRVEKMKKNMNVNYDYLIAGTSDKEAAAKTLPMLNHIMSFPTTIFIDRAGKVRKIHTGFSGPATGDYYTKYVDEFNFFMDGLLSEK